MNTKLVEDIAAAVLYEGYLLYPYRASALKNRQRFNWGVLYPRDYAGRQTGADACSMRAECLVRAGAESVIRVRIRFLHLIACELNGQPWQGAMEREIAAPAASVTELTFGPRVQTVAFHGMPDQQDVDVTVAVVAEQIEAGVYKICVCVSNSTDCNCETREQALLQSLVSTHAILFTAGAEFISLLEPSPELRSAANRCNNNGFWPILAGEEGSHDAMLVSPIILYDYPQIAPESPGALFDGGEIDEILSLRIMTLTDEEKRAMRESDGRAQEILDRTDAMPPEQFMKLHGVLRSLRSAEGDRP